MHRNTEKILRQFELDKRAFSCRGPIEIPDTTRLTLLELFRDLGFRTGAEIGVETGEYSEQICKIVEPSRLYCIDPWKRYGGYRDHVNQEKLDQFYDHTRRRLAPYPVWIIREFSTTAARRIPDGSLDFVYIDANHDYAHVVEDLATWAPKVKIGGIVAGHDFREHKGTIQVHVVHAVRGWAISYRIEPWFVLGLKEAPWKPREGWTRPLRDESRSWFYVKETKRNA